MIAWRLLSDAQAEKAHLSNLMLVLLAILVPNIVQKTNPNQMFGPLYYHKVLK